MEKALAGLLFSPAFNIWKYLTDKKDYDMILRLTRIKNLPDPLITA